MARGARRAARIERAFVVHGADGLGRADADRAVHLFDVRPGRVAAQRALARRTTGCAACSAADLAGGDAAYNARALTRSASRRGSRRPSRLPAARRRARARGGRRRLRRRAPASSARRQRSMAAPRGACCSARQDAAAAGAGAVSAISSMRWRPRVAPGCALRASVAREGALEETARATPAPPRSAARCGRLRSHRGAQAALAGRRRARQPRVRGPRRAGRGLRARRRRRGLGAHRAQPLRRVAGAPAARGACARAARRAGDAQGLPRRSLPGARGARRRRGRRAGHPAHAVAFRASRRCSSARARTGCSCCWKRSTRATSS